MAYTDKEKKRLRKTFLDLAPELEKAEKRLSNLIAEIATQIEDTSLVRLRVRGTRLKSLESVLRKAERKGITAENVLHEIHDLVGIRLVCNNLEDVFRFYELLRESLHDDDIIVKEDFVSRPQQSGYRALHLNLYIDVGNPFCPVRIPCEIQLRTLLQDSWAELTHDDVYKSDIDLPEDLKGRMEDLSKILAAADDIAQKVRKRIGREFQSEGPINLTQTNKDGYAYLFGQAFGRKPSEHFIREAEKTGKRTGLVTLHRLEEVLRDQPFLESIRSEYTKFTGFGFSPSSEFIFLGAINAAAQDMKTALKYIRRQARNERKEINLFWRHEVLVGLPDTIHEFLDQAREGNLSVEEIAEVWGIAGSCAVCGTTIVDLDAFSNRVAEYYDFEDDMAISSELINMDAGWADGRLCSYHAYRVNKDQDD